MVNWVRRKKDLGVLKNLQWSLLVRQLDSIAYPIAASFYQMLLCLVPITGPHANVQPIEVLTLPSISAPIVTVTARPSPVVCYERWYVWRVIASETYIDQLSDLYANFLRYMFRCVKSCSLIYLIEQVKMKSVFYWHFQPLQYFFCMPAMVYSDVNSTCLTFLMESLC